MKHDIATANLHPAALGPALNELGNTSDLCIKVLTADGRIDSVNRRGLEILGVSEVDFCGHVWSSFWTGSAAEDIANAIARGLRGTTTEMTLQFGAEGGLWDIRVMPLHDANGEITRVLGVSRKLGDAPETAATDAEPELQEKLEEAMHSLGNLIASSHACTRLLRRSAQDDATLSLLDEMARIAETANRTLDGLRGQEAS